MTRFPSFSLIISQVALLAASASYAGSSDSQKNEPRKPCSSSKEFVTTLEFLRSQKAFELKEDQARKAAESVAKNCTHKNADQENTAKRFIRVTELLVKSGLTSNNAIETALEFSARTDIETEAFITIFRYSFLHDYLDLDIMSSLQMAKKLSSDFDGNTKQAVSDFEKLVKYCASEKFLDLPKPQCGEMAARLAKLGEKENKGIADSWINTFEFLRSNKKGPGLATSTALQVSEEILKVGGGTGLENFMQAYRYATNKSGLDMNVEEAMAFAKRMASITLPDSR